jgi:MYXO-CTERM domain-containing protein
MNRRLVTFAATAATALAIGGAAQAHVTVHPNALPAGGFTMVDVQVPSERPTQPTTKVDVQLPSGIVFLSHAPVAGWTAKVTYRKLAKPIEVFGEKFTQEARRVTWTARAGGVGPGQILAFPLSIRVPDGKKGTVLTFKAVQTYRGGEVVRWIGKPDSEEPAPQVVLRGANEAVADFPAGVAAAKRSASSSPTIGFIVGLPVLGLAGLALLRRRSSS